VVAQARLDAQPLASVAAQIQRDRLARVDVGLAVRDACIALDVGAVLSRAPSALRGVNMAPALRPPAVGALHAQNLPMLFKTR
jgi:hypothetical protein